jgi:hypothetical protein
MREALLPLVHMTAALSDWIVGYDEKIAKLAREKYVAYGLIAAGKRGGANHIAGLRIDFGESGTIREESRCGTVSGIGTGAGGLRGESAAIRNQQGGGHDGAPAAGRERL